MGSVDYLSYGFALVVMSGGVMGYFKAGKYCTESVWRLNVMMCSIWRYN